MIVQVLMFSPSGDSQLPYRPANPKVVSERLGYATVTLTLDTYSHVLPSMQQAASDKLESLLFEKVGTR